MTLGIILYYHNNQYFDNRINTMCEFIPQIIFLESIFGYLSLTIIYKWLTNWNESPPPGLLNMLIFMFLSPGHIKDGEHLYIGQVYCLLDIRGLFRLFFYSSHFFAFLGCYLQNHISCEANINVILLQVMPPLR